MFLIVFASNGLYCQQVIIDTFSYYSYGEYCEDIMVCEYLVPDSTFLRLNGKIIGDVGYQLKYQNYCFRLGYDNQGELYSFKDFELQIGNMGFEFSYPQYSFIIPKKSLCENLKDTKLFSHKTKETINVKTLYLTKGNSKKTQFNLPADNLKLYEFLASIDNKNRILKIEVDSIFYPNHKEECGSITTHFPAINFKLK